MHELTRVAYGPRAVIVAVGDLTAAETDVVVNAANADLAHGGGVARALARAGGRAVEEDSADWIATHGRVGRGEAAVTTAGAMPARHLVHVVGPRYRRRQDNAGLLAEAVTAALDAAADLDAASVALPAISAGIYGYPLAEATAVIAGTVSSWLSTHTGSVTEVTLVAVDDEAGAGFQAGLAAAS